MRGACVVLLLVGCSFRSHEVLVTDASRDGSVDATHDAPRESPALVQQAIASADNSDDPVVATLPSKPAAGHLLVMMGGDSGGALTSVSGGGVATWTRSARSLANVNIELWYGISDGTSAAVTITYPQHNDPIWQLVTEWSGVTGQGMAASASGTASPANGSTQVAPGDLVVFAVADLTPNTFGTPAQGTWTALTAASTTTTTQLAWYTLATTTTTLAPTVTETAHSWDAAIASFQAAH